MIISLIISVRLFTVVIKKSTAATQFFGNGFGSQSVSE